MRVVVDTNVFVSAVLSPTGPPAQILDLILSKRITLLLSPLILAEYTEVLKRKEFSFSEPLIHALLRVIAIYAEQVAVSHAARLLPDPDDQPFLSCALEGHADFLITGNKKHFPDHLCHPIQPLSPSEFLKKLI